MYIYACCERDLRRQGAEEGEISFYSRFWPPKNSEPFDETGHYHDSYTSPSAAYAYVYREGMPDKAEDADVMTNDDSDGLRTMTIRPRDGSEPYCFEMQEQNNLLRQTGGPERPFVIGNFGSAPLRVDTISGQKFTVPCGMIRRLSGIGARPAKKVLLTFRYHTERLYSFPMLLRPDGSWRKLDVVRDRFYNFAVMDDGAIVAQYKHNVFGLTVYDRWGKDPDYELFLRQDHCKIRCFGMGLVNGVYDYRAETIQDLKDGLIYDFALLRQGCPPERCAAVLPNVPPVPNPEDGMDSI